MAQPSADWFFYEFKEISCDFDDYEDVSEEDKVITFGAHYIAGLAPSKAGRYYWKVIMKYNALDPDEEDTIFATELELVVKGTENPANHRIHLDNGYQHGLGDHMNESEREGALKLIIAGLLMITFITASVVVITRCVRKRTVRNIEIAEEV